MSLLDTIFMPGAFVPPWWLFLRHMPLLPALGFTAAFAMAAWGVRAVTVSGALAGFVLAVIACLAVGPPGFLAILALFLLTWLATRFGYGQKLHRGLAEADRGRSATQVLANLGAAVMTIAPMLWWRSSLSAVLLVGFAAALAEAAADTVSGEIGQVLSPRRAYLITNFEKTSPGTDGAISFAGTVAGVIASGAVAAVCVYFNLLLPRWFGIATLSGVAGMLLDSLLGATLERPTRLGNNSVNFLSSGFSAFVAILLAFLWR